MGNVLLHRGDEQFGFRSRAADADVEARSAYMRLVAEFYTIRHIMTGQHVAQGGGYTQDIDSMVTPIKLEAAERVLNTLPDKADHRIARWTMVEVTL